MKTFVARNAKQLDLYLRLIHMEELPFTVNVVKNDKQKIVYEISVEADQQKLELLSDKIQVFTS